MDKLTDKVAYLKGLAEGLNLNPDTPENKLLLKMMDVLADLSGQLEELRGDHDDLAEYVDNIDEDLEDIEALLFDEEDDEDMCGCGHCHDEDDGMEGEMEYECPHCGYQTKFDLADFDFDEDYLCPQCHKSFFPESEDEDDDDDVEEEENPQDER
jgi:DNA-directed RNA polymerase subunit RPC12/RpoP